MSIRYLKVLTTLYSAGIDSVSLSVPRSSSYFAIGSFVVDTACVSGCIQYIVKAPA